MAQLGTSAAARNDELLPRWIPASATLIALGGLAVSLYLTLVHYSSVVPLACSSTGAIDCARVITSPQSVVFGVPVAVYGVAYFCVMVALDLPVVWRSPSPWVARARAGAAAVGVCVVLYLVAVELLVVDAICVWCTAAHVLAFLLFLVVATGTARTGLGWRDY